MFCKKKNSFDLILKYLVLSSIILIIYYYIFFFIDKLYNLDVSEWCFIIIINNVFSL